MKYDGSGTNASQDSTSYYKFMTQDGASIMINSTFAHCSSPGWSTGKTSDMTKVCGTFFIDVNGPKPPNDLGRDIFSFYMINKALLYPSGGIDDKYYGSNNSWTDPSTGNPRYCTSTDKSGEYCAGRIMEEGWQMNY